MATGRAAVEQIASEAGISRAAMEATGMPLAGDPAAITDRALVLAVTAVRPA